MVSHLAPAAPTMDTVLVAAHDLSAGHVLAPGDLIGAALPRSTRPEAVVTHPVGRTLASPLRRGEPVTDVRLTGPGLLAGQPLGTVAVAVRLTDPGAALFLRPGDRVDLIAGPASGGVPLAGAEDSAAGLPSATTSGGESDRAVALARAVLVLAVPGASGDGDPGPGAASSTGGLLGVTGGSGVGADGAGDRAGLLVVAVDRRQAVRLAAATGTRSLSVALTAEPPQRP